MSPNIPPTPAGNFGIALDQMKDNAVPISTTPIAAPTSILIQRMVG